MIFFYHPLAGEKEIVLKEEWFHSLIRVRRKKSGESVVLQNLQDGVHYEYRIEDVNKRDAILILQSFEKKECIGGMGLKHLLWGVCDAKTVYATLPVLFQLGVQKISFVWCDRSQKNIVLDPEKIHKILYASAEQCGRNVMMKWEEISFSEVLEHYPKTLLCDFGRQKIHSSECNKGVSFFVGPEGGFTEHEKNQFSGEQKRSFVTDAVLKSETACIVVASSCLLGY